MKKLLLTLFISSMVLGLSAQNIQLARLKYSGGGDWYSSKTALKNLIEYCNSELKTNLMREEALVEPGSANLFNFPYVFATGHGNMFFSEADVQNLRTYLEGGGFIHFCDNFGFDAYVRREMKKVFPELDFQEVPYNHPIFKSPNAFPKGLPKIHEHEGNRPQAFGLFYQGRLICFYDYECDLGNGWEDLGTYPEDSPEIHTLALKMGANIIQYVFNQ